MNNINTSFKKIYFLLILTSLFFLISINKTHSEEKIGTIVSLKNEVFAINAEGEKRLLNLYDEILLQDEILTNELSTVTAQYNDSSTIIIKELSSFKVTDFNITGLKDIFIGVVEKGSVIIESGKIAKKNDGSMTIVLPTMTLNVKGTRFNIENNPDGTSEVSLAEDSFGNVGTISISSEGEVKTLFDTDQVISVNTETGISERPKTDDEKQELVNVSNDLIKASSIDENVIQKNLEEKLLNGSLLDANGDGVIDVSDIDIIKEGIKLEKQEKLDFIVDNSTGDNTEFLSQVLNQSDETSIGQSMDKIFESNNDLLTSVITNLASEDNTFLTTSNSETNNAIKEKIYTQMLNDFDNDNNNIALIGNIISKSDGATVERMVNFVEISDANNEGSSLSLQVLSSVADSTSFYNVDFGGEEQAQIDRLMETAVFSAANSEDGAMLLANIMSKGSEESVYMMMDTIGQVGETFTDSTLALEVLSSMADNESFEDMNFEGEGQAQFDQMMEDAVFSAATSEDGAMMLGNMMANGSEESMGMMMDTIGKVGKTFTDSTLALEVLSSMADNESFEDMNFEGEGQAQFDQMMEDAVFSAATSEDGAMMLGNMMANGSEESMGMMMDTIGQVGETFTDSTLALEVLSSMADNESFEDMNFEGEGQAQFDQMMEDAVFSAATSEDGAMMLGNMMANGSEESMGMMMDTIGKVGKTFTDSTLALEVLSSMADNESFEDMNFEGEGQAQFDQMMEDAVFSAATSEDGAMMLGNIITKSDAATVGTMLDSIATVSAKDSNSTLAAQVLSEVATTAVTNNIYFDTEKMNQFNDLVDTVAFTNTTTTADDDAAAALALATANIAEDDAADLYDASGFAFAPPYYHKDTGTIYNDDGLDKNGNSMPSSGNSMITYDAAGFNMETPYYHKDTGTIYDSDGYDKYGNSQGGGSVAWTTTQGDFPSTLTKGTGITSISLSASGVGTISYTYSGTLPDGLDLMTGSVSGTPSTVQAATSVTITATDEDNNTSNLAVNFPAVTAGGSVAWTTTQGDFPSTLTKGTGITSISLSASGVGTISYTYSGTLPDGLDLMTGSVSGTPSTVQAATSVTITATDEDNNTSNLAVNFPAVTAGGSVAWTTTQGDFPSTLTKGTGITSISLSASGVGTISYTYSGTLPDGLDLRTGSVSGTPSTVQAATSVTITATDEDNNTSNLAVNFPAVTAGGSVAWTTTQGDFPSTLTKGTGITSISLSASGVGTISYTYSGTLPDGLDLMTGSVSGTPSTVQAATSVTITATDEDNNTSNLAVNFPAVTAGGTYNAKGFSNSSPFKHQNGTAYDSDGRDYQGYNEAGYNSEGMSSADPPIYNSAYDVSPA